MTCISTAEAIAMGLIPAEGAKTNKYNVSSSASRTHNGRVYASKAEMLYARELEMRGDVRGFAEQPQVQLGPDTRYRPDFVVITDTTIFVDIKGMETPEFKKVKKLWAKYMKVPLHVIKRERGRFVTVEVL